MGASFVLFYVSMEIHRGKFTLGNGGRLFTIYMRKPFGSRFGQLVSKFRNEIFLSGLAFTICTNPSHLQRESGTGIKDEV